MRALERMALIAGAAVGLPLSAGAAGEPAALEELPAGAKEAIAAQARGHRITGVSRQTAPNGGTYYEAGFKTITDGQVAVDVAADGRLLGKFRKLDEPSGDGP